ncbi:MAG: hypothetical protein U1E97_06745 [Alphaproteobacteria bacterium]
MNAAKRRRFTASRLVPWIVPAALGLIDPGLSQAATQIRAAVHDGFGRLAIEWPDPVRHEVSQDGRRVVLRFTRPADGSLAQVREKLDRYLANAVLTDGGRSAILELAADVQIKTALYEDRIVAVDFIISGGRAAAAPMRGDTPRSAGAEAAKGQPGVAVRFGEHDAYDRIVIDWPTATSYDVRASDNHVTVSFDSAVRLDLQGLPQEETRYFRAARLGDGARAPLELDVMDGVRVRHFRAGPKLVLDLMPRQDLNGPASGPKASEIKRLAAIEPRAGLVESPAEPPLAGPGKAFLQRSGQGISLHFGWQHPIGAAVFERAGYIWIVFDTSDPLDLSGIPAAPRSVVSEIKPVDTPDARAVRVTSLPGFHPVARRDGSTWIIELVQRAATGEGGLQVRSDSKDGVITRWFVPVLLPTRSVDLADPEVGDRLQVVPLPGQGQGLKGGRETAFFRLLPTAQGIVVEPRHDAIALRSTNDGIEIVDRRDRPIQMAAPQRVAIPVAETPVAKTRPTPADEAPVTAAATSKPPVLPRSEATANPAAPAETLRPMTTPRPAVNGQKTPVSVMPAVQASDRRLFDLAAWGDWNKPYDEARLARLDALIDAPEQARNKKRIELAGFFFAHARAPEALGLLEVAAQTDEQVARDIGFRAMRGALRILAGRIDEAAQDMADPALNEYSDGLVWLAALAAERGETHAAASGFATAHGTVLTYPEPIRRRLARLAVEALAIEKLDEAAESYAAMLESLADTPERKAEVSYVRGRIALGTGDQAEARRHFDLAVKGLDRRSRAEASYHLIEMALADKEIGPKEAADRFDKLRFAWRGGPFEIQLLKRLGQSYIAAGDRRRGLDTLQYASARLDNEQDKEIKAIMREAFEGLFMSEDSARTDPMAAISIFEAHKDLVPSGDRGDRILRNLADRLIDVDLLDRARDLLATLVRERLKGEAKAEAGYRLALVEMLDRNPDGAIKALSDSDEAGLPPTMIRDRRLLAAEALASRGRDQEALKALLDDQGAESERLRADIHVKNGRWREAAQIHEKLLAGVAPGRPLAPDEARVVLNRGVALAMLGDNAGLAALRDRFAAQMGTGPEAAAFGLLTSTPAGNRSYENIAAQVKLAQKLVADFADYRRRLKSPNGATN